MTEKRTSLEVIAPTIEEAVQKGLGDLGLAREAIEVEILDEGSRGLFGLGSRQARVRLTIKSAPSPEKARRVEAEPTPSRPTVQTAPQPVPEPSPAEEDYVLTTARETVRELLGKMKVRGATVVAGYGEASDARNRAPISVNVHGDDLSILIGRRAETLNALQYITSLIVSKEIGRYVPIIVDVEGYRVRREGQLRQLARRMAEQAIKTGRRQILEPMPANERRIIHIELRQNPKVKTESVGEEPRRKVTIIPEE
ncbi:MAG TPA: RNA-binding cell elongation regulator Jag/EloR [Anaerolineales bacterium]|jgi:spoIIIJ-associated protein|nr:RNA-binding cell elongation regulator Jag/EloR [Anaerolineales bacterium]